MQFIRQTPSLQYSFPTPCNAKKLKELDIYVACKIAGLLAAAALEVPPHRIVAPGRCTRNEAKARHVAMYIAHVAAGIPRRWENIFCAIAQPLLMRAGG